MDSNMYTEGEPNDQGSYVVETVDGLDNELETIKEVMAVQDISSVQASSAPSNHPPMSLYTLGQHNTPATVPTNRNNTTTPSHRTTQPHGYTDPIIQANHATHNLFSNDSVTSSSVCYISDLQILYKQLNQDSTVYINQILAPKIPNPNKVLAPQFLTRLQHITGFKLIPIKFQSLLLDGYIYHPHDMVNIFFGEDKKH